MSNHVPRLSSRRTLGILALLAAGSSLGAWSCRAAPDARAAAPARLRTAIKYDMIDAPGDVRARFELARSLGFEGVEIDSPSNLSIPEVVAASKATGVAVHGVIDSIHWSKRFSDPDPAVRAEAVAALRGAIEDAHAVGADTVLVVPGAVRDPARENFDQVWSRSHEEIAKVLPLARERGVRIAIEVVWNDFLTTPEQLVRYVDEFHDPVVGAYFDCSNMIKYGVPPARWIEALGPRLLKVDFKGYSRERGWVAIGEGDEDWPAVLRALEAVGYHGWITAEVQGGGREELLDVRRRMDRILSR